MQIKRGDVWYIESGSTTGSEQRPGRPAIVVSNNKNNEHSATVEIVYLTTRPKRDLPTHVIIRSIGRESIALCEQITTVAVERIGEYRGHVTHEEMVNLESAMLVSLDLYLTDPQDIGGTEDNRVSTETDVNLLARLTESEIKCTVIQQMYNALLERVVKG